jgi:hypothetical protein
MRIIDIIESDDPLMDLVRAKEAGFSPDSLDGLVDRFVAADTASKPVTAPAVVGRAIPPQAKLISKALTIAAKPAAPIPTAPGAVSWTAVRDYLISKGLSTAHVIGMLANIQHESSFKPDAHTVDTNGLPSGGLFQHNGPRFTSLTQALGKSWPANWKGQIDFALNEPDGRKYVSARFTDPHAASKWWTMNFERPAKASQTAQTRAKTATRFAGQPSR